MNIQVQIKNLLPSSSYFIYCVVRNSIGLIGSSKGAIMSTKNKVHTLCFKEIIFTNAPSFVLNDPSFYTEGAKADGENVFHYKIKHAPDAYITISPALYYLNGSSIEGGYAISPKVQNVSVGTGPFASSFVVSITSAATIPNYVKVVLNIKSKNGLQEYYTPSSLLNVLGTADLLPPNMLSVQFNGEGTSMKIVFDAKTDNGKQSVVSSWSCDVMFDFVGAPDSSCFWLDEKTVQVLFPTYMRSMQYNLVEVNGRVSLLAERIRGKCLDVDVSKCDLYAYARNKTILVDNGENPMKPVVIVTVPRYVAFCRNTTDMIINLTGSLGSGGRAWKDVVWQVTTEDNSDVSLLQAYLNSFPITKGLQKIIIDPAKMLLATMYLLCFIIVAESFKPAKCSLSYL
jgi:hypothetical protein